MTRFDYQLRGWLYFLIAVLGAGTQYLHGYYQEGATVLLAGLVAVRAFIDKSPTERDATKAQEQSAAVGAIDSAPPISTGTDGAGTGG